MLLRGKEDEWVSKDVLVIDITQGLNEKTVIKLLY